MAIGRFWHSPLSTFGDDEPKYTYRKCFHAKFLRIGGCNAAQDTMVSTIISTYGKSGMVIKTNFVFSQMSQDFLSHNLLVWSYAFNYPSDVIVEFYYLSERFRPSTSTIQAALYACDIGGFHSEAICLVDFLEDKYNIDRISHLNSIVGMVLRGGDFELAMKLIAEIEHKLNQMFINYVFVLCTNDEEAQIFVTFLAQKNIRYTILPHHKRVFQQVIWILAKQQTGKSF